MPEPLPTASHRALSVMSRQILSVVSHRVLSVVSVLPAVSRVPEPRG
ncbi:hypothetical protein MUK60_31560 [Streptomyces sp. LRE541]|nr:hypothetical protein [Streptomyces sp. LRE541]UPZ31931.1 hypothetical protein MUK60_31560 [Streptomyces sp. LRE541]